MKKRIIIFGNGTLHEVFLQEIRRGDYIVGVDRAAHWLLIHGITPDVAIGDFDSTTPEELESIKKRVKDVKIYPPEKDFTDMELAVSCAIERNPQDVIIFGGIGSRVDHTMSTIQLLEKFLASNIPVVLKDISNELRLINKKHKVKKSQESTYISLLPVTRRVSVTLDGFRYNVEKKEILRSQSLGVSNEIVDDEAIIEVHEGKVLVICSRD